METNPNVAKFRPGDAISYEGRDGVYCSDAPLQQFPPGGLALAAIIEIDGKKITVPRCNVTARSDVA